MMQPSPPRRNPYTGAGLPGCGCGFLLVLVLTALFWFPTSTPELLIVLALAAAGGFLGYRHGDRFFDRILSAMRWTRMR